MQFTESALHLTQFGFKVFPLMPGQKIPAIAKRDGGRGCLEATDDENIIAAWGQRFPRANIGLACGTPSGVLVIDLDPRNGSADSIERLAKRKQTFPPTVTAQTANGGMHLYFAYEPQLKNSKSALAPGIDIKTTGGYVVAPPSVLDGGRQYAWLASPLGDCFPSLPRWVIEELKPKPKPVLVYERKSMPKDIAPLADFVSRASAGERNNSLFWAACRAAESGMLDNNAMAALLSAALSIGLDRIESEKTIRSAAEKKKLA